jgi:2-desacetyl-2-hydroxyethyl bacteriochlorophyllide A dehydrogenase
MLSIFCDTPGTLTARNIEKPIRKADEVMVRIRRIGVCGTDLHIFSGNQPYLSYPRVMGHELSGTVDEAPEGSALKSGDVVTILPYISCGKCSACLKGKTNCCKNIAVLGVHCDGGMVEYLSLPERCVIKADGLSLDQAAMTEFLAIGAHAVRRGSVEAGQEVLIVGAGPIGMAVAVFALSRGAEVTLLDGRADRLNFCKNELKAQHIVQLGDSDTDQLTAITNGDYFDVVFDATGNAKAMERGFSLVGHGGSYVLVSIIASDITFNDPEFHKRETTLLGSRNATPEDFDVVLTALRAGQVPDALITHRMALSDVPEQFAGLLNQSAGVVKAMISTDTH